MVADSKKPITKVALTFVIDLKPDEVVARKHNPNTEKYDDVSGVIINGTTHQGKHALQVTYTIVSNRSLDLYSDVGEISDPVSLAETLSTPNTGLKQVNSWLFTHPKK